MKTTTVLAVASGVSGAVATFINAASYVSPQNVDNHCEAQQVSGFDWQGLSVGTFTEYSGFSFSGWTVVSGFNKRNAHLSARTGQLALMGLCSTLKETSPSFSSVTVEKFSITHVDISVEFNTDLEFHYDMPDGSTCKHRSTCSTSGSIVQNTQCGGATKVTIVYPTLPNPPKENCEIAVHQVKFDCDAAMPTQTVEAHTTVHQTTSTIYATTVSTIKDCGNGVAQCPPYAYNGTNVAYVTKTIPVSTTVFPATVTNAVTKVKVLTPGMESVKVVKPSTPQVTKAALPCPEVVPSCLNTWMFTVGCKDNTDSACFCTDATFVKNVFTCMYAHGESDDVIAEAVTFFQGICAPQAPYNPAVVTGAETIAAVITATAKHSVSAQYTTLVVPATEVMPYSVDGTVIEGSSTTHVVDKTIAVPEVGFQTGSEGAVDVIATTPAPYSPVPTGAAPSGAAPTEGAPTEGAPIEGAPTVHYPEVDATITHATPMATGGVVPTVTSPVQFVGAASKDAGSWAMVSLAFMAAVAMV